MKRFPNFIFTLLLLPAASFAQAKADRGLVVSGSVVSVEPVCINEKPAARIGIYVQFRNEGDAPILLIPPEIPYFERRLKFVPEGSGNSETERVLGDSLVYNPYLDNPFGTPTAEDYDPNPSYVARLVDSKKPPKQLEAGGYYEFQDTLWVRTGFKITSSSTNTTGKCSADKIALVPEFPYFTVEYYLSVAKYDRGTDLLRRLQERWRAFGHFPLDDKGNVSYRSQNILLSKEGK
jgi:hypothetical protein